MSDGTTTESTSATTETFDKFVDRTLDRAIRNLIATTSVSVDALQSNIKKAFDLMADEAKLCSLFNAENFFPGTELLDSEEGRDHLQDVLNFVTPDPRVSARFVEHEGRHFIRLDFVL